MRFTKNTGLKKTPFELHHGRKPRTELPNIEKLYIRSYQIGQNCPFQHLKTKNTDICWKGRRRRNHQLYGNDPHEDR